MNVIEHPCYFIPFILIKLISFVKTPDLDVVELGIATMLEVVDEGTDFLI